MRFLLTSRARDGWSKWISISSEVYGPVDTCLSAEYIEASNEASYWQMSKSIAIFQEGVDSVGLKSDLFEVYSSHLNIILGQGIIWGLIVVSDW